jgi:predicted RND superfamily exporter protein
VTPLERYAAWHYRRRWWLASAFGLLVAILLPSLLELRLENSMTAWFSRDDPNWIVYREYREEFGGSRNVVIAVEAADVYTAEVLSYLRRVTSELERLPDVLRVYSLANANRVVATEDELLVRSYLEDLESQDPEEVRRRVAEDEGILGDMVSRDGTVASIIVTFDEESSTPLGVLLAEVRRIMETGRPRGARLHYNGNMEISDAYDRASRSNIRFFTPLTVALLAATSYWLFRSFSRVALLLVSTAIAVGSTLAVFSMLGFKFNVVSTALIPLIAVLAVADDVHLLQLFDREAATDGDLERAFRRTIVALLPPVAGASATTALGLLSLATSRVAAVREFGVAAAIGVSLDLVVSFALVPLALTLMPTRSSAAPASERISRWILAVARSTRKRSGTVLLVTAAASVLAGFGMLRLRTSTNHMEFFPPGNELRTSQAVIDGKLSGIHNFEVVLEGPVGVFQSPEVLRKVEVLSRAVEGMEHVTRAVSFLDSLKKVHAELARDSGGAGETLPTTREAVAQELLLFGMSEQGRDALRSFVSSDFSRMRIWVKMPSVSSEESTERTLAVERLARASFADADPPIDVVVTGAGQMFTALDLYLVRSQLSSFATAFVLVFAVIFMLFRSVRYGLISIVPNLTPVILILGLMGWLSISLNVATVMVASIALGVIDDDTVHFLMNYRRSRDHGIEPEDALEHAILDAGAAAFVSAIINCLGFGAAVFSEYKPTAYWGGLLALIMLLAFLSEILLLPACLRSARRFFPGSEAAR